MSLFCCESSTRNPGTPSAHVYNLWHKTTELEPPMSTQKSSPSSGRQIAVITLFWFTVIFRG